MTKYSTIFVSFVLTAIASATHNGQRQLRGLAAAKRDGDKEDGMYPVPSLDENIKNPTFHKYRIMEVSVAVTPDANEKQSDEGQDEGNLLKGQGFFRDLEVLDSETLQNGTDFNISTRAIVGGSDERTVIQDRNMRRTFPYRAVGKFFGQMDSMEKHCTGTVVGRRLLLTAKHCVKLDSKGNLIPYTFSPAYHNGREDPKFGTARATKAYYWGKPYHDFSDEYMNIREIANDYAVVVLDRAIGDLVGYLNVVTWQDEWKDGPYWYSVGYPYDILGGQNMVLYRNSAVQKIIKKRGYDDAGQALMLQYNVDTGPGQSGSPLYGKFGDDYKIVAVHSASNNHLRRNFAAGGKALSSLIAHAKNRT